MQQSTEGDDCGLCGCAALVIAAATHPRLGCDSPAALLPQDLLATIVQLADREHCACPEFDHLNRLVWEMPWASACQAPAAPEERRGGLLRRLRALVHRREQREGCAEGGRPCEGVCVLVAVLAELRGLQAQLASDADRDEWDLREERLCGQCLRILVEEVDTLSECSAGLLRALCRSHRRCRGHGAHGVCAAMLDVCAQQHVETARELALLMLRLIRFNEERLCRVSRIVAPELSEEAIKEHVGQRVSPLALTHYDYQWWLIERTRPFSSLWDSELHDLGALDRSVELLQRLLR
eukprot:m51a1_g5893 hypothetical protein (295) ;mRNA; r:533589-534684